MQDNAAGSAQPEPTAIVRIGVAEVHQFLLQRLQGLVTQAIAQRCNFELGQQVWVMFTKHVVHTVLAGCGSYVAGEQHLKLFQPLLQRLMLGQLSPGRRQTVDAVLVPAIMAALKCVYLGAQLRQMLQQQVCLHCS
jgi:hypothetical protein